jgi:hypothetical protein
MIVYYVSAHGYGHAGRSSALMSELKFPVTVVTTAPARFFPGLPVEAPFPSVDLGLIQREALEIDLEATRLAHARLEKSWDEGVAFERARLRRLKARLVICDVPALPFAAAAAEKIPSAAVANFDWDWLLSTMGLPSGRHAEAYAQATLYLRLPMGAPTGAFRRLEEMPLLARRSVSSRQKAREILGFSQSEKVALVAFGGFESSFKIDLPGWRLLRLGAAEPPLPFVDLMLACDTVVAKPGYGTFAEAILHERPILHVPRPGFPEVPFILDWAARHGHVRPLSEGPFEGALSWPPSRKDGAAVIAARLGQLLA